MSQRYPTYGNWPSPLGGQFNLPWGFHPQAMPQGMPHGLQGMPMGMPLGMPMPQFPRAPRKTTQFGFQPVYNQSSMIPQHRPSHFQQGPQIVESQGEEEVEIGQSENPVEAALQKNPEFLSEVSLESLRLTPNIFQIDLETYPLCPWKRLDPKTAHPQQFRQWFNYNLTPKTWTRYAEDQRRVQAHLNELMQNK